MRLRRLALFPRQKNTEVIKALQDLTMDYTELIYLELFRIFPSVVLTLSYLNIGNSTHLNQTLESKRMHQ